VIDIARVKRDDKREREGKPRQYQDPQIAALYELPRLAGLKC